MIRASAGGAAHQLAAHGCDGCGAGSSAAGASEASAAFPYDQADMIVADDLREVDVDAGGEERISLDQWAETIEVHTVQIVHEEDDMRVADIDRGGGG